MMAKKVWLTPPAAPRSSMSRASLPLALFFATRAGVNKVTRETSTPVALFDAGILAAAHSAAQELSFEDVVKLLTDEDGSPRFPHDTNAVLLLAHAYIECKLFGACITLIDEGSSDLLYANEHLFCCYVVALVETNNF